ncbi:serine aminopeptidase S33 family [Lachnotalea glycerini]|uniref:Serine aminopeptidase S33 family n=1 Tax=Lachnotalea glycerini TaxID=1763509 RepID=A0A318EQ01_9FIRM|nr:alpha/beta hydrolase [Lachnotalea glycerini]PXV87815.1 serine aminopeptidase S33 family [Lachnotalea glycerini]
MGKTRKAVKWLIISLVLMLLGCGLASGINTNLGKVNVSEFEFSTERGTLSAYLYMPKGASADNPRPVIVLTHGYLNSKEMQDATAVEMSRRGYIVLVVDQYDHGLSRWNEDIPNGAEFGTFWVYSMFDAVTYAYNQDYTLKDANGNAYIGCSGHSMGGLSTVMSVYFDEMQSLQSGHRMIYAAIPESADFTFTTNIAPIEDILAAYGNRTMGIVSGHYDEFFFGESEGAYYKDFINSTQNGAKFLGLNEGEVGEYGKFYDVDSGAVVVDGNKVRDSQTGKRIVYEVNEAHAQNHFSVKVESEIVDFFQTAFNGVTTSDMTLANMTSDNQVWWLKESGNFIALIGFFLFFVPFITIITKVGFLKNAVTEETSVIPLPNSSGGKVVFGVVLVAFSLLPGILYVPLMNKVAADISVLRTIMIIFAVIMLLIGIRSKAKASSDTTGKFASFARGGFAGTGISVIMIAALFGYQLFAQSPYFNSTSTNWSAYWALILGIICILMVVLTYYFVNKPHGVGLESYGIRIKPISVLASFLTAVSAFIAGYLLLFIFDGIFNVDFRIWTLAVKVFKMEHFITMLKYLPMFFLFYLILSVMLNANTRAIKHSYLVSIFSTAGGCIVWLIVQYGVFFITGKAMWATSGMIAIGMLATIPYLIVASIFTRKIYEKTNNVWTAGFFNAMLFTMIPVANTILLWNLV